MRTAIATVSLSGSLEEKLEAAAEAGFDGVEIFEPDLVASPLSPREVATRAAGLGLAIEMYQPFRDFEGVGEARLERNLRRARCKLALMAELGAGTLLVCSSVAADAIDDPDLCAEQLVRLADEAQAHGVRIAYEALAWGRHVNDYRVAWDIVERAGHPALGTCLDSFHILSRGSDPAAIEQIPGDRIFFLQLADAPVMGMDVLQWSRHFRCFPGQGGFDLPRFMAHVNATGYDGPWSLEVFNDRFRQADPQRIARDARRSLLALAEQTGDGPPLPRAPESEGFAFAELAVGPESGPQTAAVLEATGFTHVGPHRSKPVQLWRQGAACVLVNHGDEHGGERPMVSALGIESANPAGAAARAQALGARLLPRRRREDEAELAEAAAPDETSLLFCRTSSAGDSWIGDFVDVDDGPAPDAGLTGIDHVVLAQPFDSFDEAVLFYRSVLGLEPGAGQDLAAPDGLLSSRALEAADGRLRLAITVPRLGGGEGNRLGELQHLAFASDDLLASARRMRARGVRALAIPDNYYDDLAARTELDADRIAELRELDVLYDADGEGGEFLQLFTEMIGGRLFLEIVQRTGGYRGYGAANSPVRLAAQLRARPESGRHVAAQDRRAFQPRRTVGQRDADLRVER